MTIKALLISSMAEANNSFNSECVRERKKCQTMKKYSTWFVGYSIQNINLKESERAMSRIKSYAEDKFGEDWVHVLEDKEKRERGRK